MHPPKVACVRDEIGLGLNSVPFVPENFEERGSTVRAGGVAEINEFRGSREDVIDRPTELDGLRGESLLGRGHGKSLQRVDPLPK